MNPLIFDIEYEPVIYIRGKICHHIVVKSNIILTKNVSCNVHIKVSSYSYTIFFTHMKIYTDYIKKCPLIIIYL